MKDDSWSYVGLLPDWVLILNPTHHACLTLLARVCTQPVTLPKTSLSVESSPDLELPLEREQSAFCSSEKDKLPINDRKT